MSATSLLSHLRTAGISLSHERDRLIVEAPSGVITAELRTELAKQKAELIAAIDAQRARSDGDLALTTARRQIPGLLAIAYMRYTAVQRAGRDHQEGSSGDSLANSDEASVHGVVP
jgi:hypothetical protein